MFFALDHRRAVGGLRRLPDSPASGVGFTFAAMPGFIVRAVPPSETGSATGFYQVLRNIGSRWAARSGPPC